MMERNLIRLHPVNPVNPVKKEQKHRWNIERKDPVAGDREIEKNEAGEGTPRWPSLDNPLSPW